MTKGNKTRVIDLVSDESNSDELPLKQAQLEPFPVAGGSSGNGLPYAPEDWPRHGDVWRWKVGNRPAASGYWLDRYLYPPSRLRKVTGSKTGFQSRASVEDYLRKDFPEMDLDSFFSSFIWKVPCGGRAPKKGTEKNVHISKGVNEHAESESPVKAGDCKARNKLCNGQKEAKANASLQKECDICCVEADFCRDCCCILCSKTIDPAHDGYSFVKCEAIIDRNQICGHIAHIECALRSYMAGTVGGSIGLDVEYYCRRCDNKTDLMPHVTKIVQTCECLDSEDEIGRILNLGLCILRGSQQMRAKILRNGIMSILSKFKCGANLDGIWRVEDNAASVHTAGSYPKSEVTVLGARQTGKNERAADCASILHPLQKSETNHRPLYITSDDGNISAKLEDEIDLALKELKKSQESERKIAEQKLYAQKDFLLSLYRLLESERSELADPTASPNSRNCDAVLSNVLNRVDQIKREEEKFKSMLKISNGFGRAPQNILRQHFGLMIDD